MDRTHFSYAMIMISSTLLVSTGCDTPIFDPGPPDDALDPTGVWRHESGEFFFSPEKQLEYLVLDQDGILTMTFRDLNTNIINCPDTVYARIKDNALVLGIGGLVSQAVTESGVMLYAMPDRDTLELIEDVGSTTIFRRETEVPKESQCKPLSIEQTFEELAVFPRQRSGLAYDGTLLWVTDEENGMLYSINPDSGKIGKPMQWTRALDVHVTQDGDFWGVCDDCPVVLDSALAERRTKDNGQVKDSVYEIELGLTVNSFDVEALAFDDVAKVLWLHGKFNDTNRYGFLKVNAEEPEPDKLLVSVEFDNELKSIAWDGGHLWAITSYPQYVIQIDVEAFQAVATYQTPDSDIDWRGITAVGSHLYLAGKDFETDTGVLMKVSADD